ncbi:MAG: hypothetical protein ABSG32_14515 [Terriglobia bacterium]|jgi:hypothetical protein
MKNAHRQDSTDRDGFPLGELALTRLGRSAYDFGDGRFDSWNFT